MTHGEPTTGEATDPPQVPLAYGSGFTVLEEQVEREAVCLHQGPLEVFARLADGRIGCYPLRKVRRNQRHSGVAPLRPGDEVLLESPAGKLRGQLASEPGVEVVIKLRHGEAVRVPRQQVRTLSLVHPMRELIGGARFEVKSQSGNRYEGTVSQVLPDRRALVKLTTGKSVELKLDRLDLASLIVLIPVSLEPPAEGVVAEPRPSDDQKVAEADGLLAELERERRSTAVLKRKLVQLLNERDTLAKDVKERERMLESEVWRGLAAQRDLTEAKKKLEQLEDELETEQRELDGRKRPQAGA
jgi:hypothetical protein